jgi:aryl-alcohol dehydrogenase-like predicted oxidoreductase
MSFDDDVRRAHALADTAAACGLESDAELAIRFATGIAGVSTALVGFSSLDQVRDALRFAARGPLEPSADERIRALAR